MNGAPSGRAAWLLASLAAAACGRPSAQTAELPAIAAAPPAAKPGGATAAVATPGSSAGKRIALLYSSNVRGEYEPCGCPSHPLGGIARRAAATDRARAESDAVLQVDAGDLLLAPPYRSEGMTPPDRGEVERRARMLLAALARMGLTAFSPGETDLFLGPRRLAELVRQAKVPTVSANLVDVKGRRLFDADRIVDAAGVKVGIFGVTELSKSEGAAKTESAAWRAWGVSALDPAETIKEEVRSLRARGAQLVVALLHLQGGLTGARQVLSTITGVDFAVLGHDGANLDTPEEVGGARLLEAFQLGKYLGRLDLRIVGGSMKLADRGQRAQVVTILDDHKRQLDDLRQRMAEDKPGKLKEFFDRQLKTLQDAIARESQLVATLPETVTGSAFENRLVEMDAALPDQPGVAMLVHQYNQENQRRAQKGLPVGVAYTLPGANPGAATTPVGEGGPEPGDAAPLTYAGTNACGACHAPAFAHWQTTKHAHAIEALHKKGRDKDPTCVGCHATGYLQAGGTRDINVAASRFPDVGCESCHGPGLDHITAADKKSSIRRQVEAVTCLGCHTPDQTNGQFDYTLFRKAIIGPGHGAPGGTPGVSRQ